MLCPFLFHFFKETHGVAKPRGEVAEWAEYAPHPGDPWSLAVQMTIPLKAFAIFRGIVVVVDPERVFLEANNYRIFATREVAANLGEEAIREFGLLDADGQLKSATPPDGV